MEMLEGMVPPPRGWTAETLAGRPAELFYDVAPRFRDELAAAMARLRENGLTLQTVEPEDVRLPSFARDVPALRARLDHGYGFVVVRGIDVARYTDAECAVIHWALSGYMGRVVRQNLSGLRVETLKDRRKPDGDPYRLSQTNRFFGFHSDNGGLEPRTPDYIGLFCRERAMRGGESILVSSYALHNAVRAERPADLPLLYETYDAAKPGLQHDAAGAGTLRYPVFERRGGDLVMRYNRVFIEAGMERAGRPLAGARRALFDFLDGRMADESMVFHHTLQPGEILFSNNLTTLHGRTAYEDWPEPDRQRHLERSWMWRRHVWPGTDPVALDAAELG